MTHNSRLRTVTLVLGGVRSGKSRYAQAEAARFDRVTFIATARPSDAEMRKKIAAHRRDRPASWKTVESPTDLDRVIRREGRACDLLLIDCLTTYCGGLVSRPRSPIVSSRIRESSRRTRGSGVGVRGRSPQAEMVAVVDAIRSTPAHVIVVSNEVGSGVVPAFKSGRAFRDLLGETNQRVACAADRVVLLVAGLPIVLKPGCPGSNVGNAGSVAP